MIYVYKILKLIGLATAIICIENCNPSDENIIKGGIQQHDFEATKATVIQGSMKVNKLKTKDLMIQGSAKIGPKGGIVDGDLHVQGKLDAKNLKVNGNTIIESDANIEKSEFNNSVEIYNLGKIGETTIKGDLLIRNKKLIIKKGITVEGLVIFTGDKGKVSVEGVRENISLKKGIKNGEIEKDVQDNASSEQPIKF